MREYSRAVIIVAMLSAAGVAEAQTTPSGHWALDGDGVDATGGGADLTFFGTPSFAPGRFGQALVLNGIDQHAARTADDEIWDFGGGDFTIRAFVAFDNIESVAGQFIIAKWHSPGQGWYLRYNGPTGAPVTGRIFHFSDGQGTINFYGTASPSALVNGQFAHILVRRRGMSIEIYLDCVLIGTQNTSDALGNASRALTIGARHTATNQIVERMSGKIDDVRIWNSALSDVELASFCAADADAGVAMDAADPDAEPVKDAADPADAAVDPDAESAMDAVVSTDAEPAVDAVALTDAEPAMDAVGSADAEPAMDDAAPAADAGVPRDATVAGDGGGEKSTDDGCNCAASERTRGDGVRSFALFIAVAMMLASSWLVRK